MRYWEKYRPMMSEWAIRRMQQYDDMMEQYEKQQQIQRMKKEIYDDVMKQIQVNINLGNGSIVQQVKKQIQKALK